MKKLIKLHIEDIALNGITNGKIDKAGKTVGDNSSFATWVDQYIISFNNKNEIYEQLLRKEVSDDEDESKFVNNYFYSCITLHNEENRKQLSEIIKRDLSWGNPKIYEFVTSHYKKENKEKSKVYLFFKDEIDKYERGEYEFPF